MPTTTCSAGGTPAPRRARWTSACWTATGARVRQALCRARLSDGVWGDGFASVAGWVAGQLKWRAKEGKSMLSHLKSPVLLVAMPGVRAGPCVQVAMRHECLWNLQRESVVMSARQMPLGSLQAGTWRASWCASGMPSTAGGCRRWRRCATHSCWCPSSEAGVQGLVRSGCIVLCPF